jgi:hypothetical protein
MYANLRVSIARKPAKRRGGGQFVADEVLYAWRVRSSATKLIVYLDAQDGEGSYAEPAGKRSIDLSAFHVEVSADF